MYEESYSLISTALEALEEINANIDCEKDKYLALHFLRYSTKINLQTCAIKSQLDDHERAINYAKTGLTKCI